MSKNTAHNALKSATPGALTQDAPYRGAVRAPNILEISNKHPDRVYRWLSKGVLDKYGGLDRRGWEVLNEKNTQGECLATQWGITTTSTDLRVADMVLGFMPKERNEIRKQAIAQANNALQHQFASLRNQAISAGAGFNGGFSSQRDGITEKFGTPLAD